MEASRYRTYAEVDLSAIRANFDLTRKTVGNGCKILSVVKADAYGHGAVQTAKALNDSDYFGVACPDEAVTLRENGIDRPILVLGYTSPKEARRLVRYGITQCAFSAEYLNELQAELSPNDRLKVHLKIDTGMSRLGFYVHKPDDISTAVATIRETVRNTPSIEYEGIFTHFAAAECDPDGTKTQFSLFTQLTDALQREGIEFRLRHCANSAAVFLYPEMHLDMVRPGITLYGYLPDDTVSTPQLHPAMELKTYVSQVHDLFPGDTVSYNRTFRATQPMKIATLCIGYADGLSRNLSNGAPILINGHRTKILGRVAMDQCVIDVTGIDVKSGDIATIFGKSGDLQLTAWDTANAAGTIPYEILCAVAKRVPRIYSNRENEV